MRKKRRGKMGRGQDREGRDMLNNTSHPRSKSIRVKFGVGMDDGGDSGCEVEGREEGTTASSNGHVLLENRKTQTLV